MKLKIGGAGMLFSNESMNRLVKNFENGFCSKFIDGYGDYFNFYS